MRKALFAILALAVLSLPAFAQQTGVVPITVTNTAANIVADGTCSRVSCTAVIVKENAATPTAIFSVTPRGSTTAINLPAGGSFEFDASATNPIIAGQVLGTVVATTSGPFNFVAIESPARPSNANIPASSGGGGGTPGGSPTQIQYNLGGSFAGIPNSDAFSTGQVILAPVNPANTETAGLIVSTTSTDVGASDFDSIFATSTTTDNLGEGGATRGGFFQGELLGSNVASDGVYGAVAVAINDASGGNPGEISGFNVLPLENFGLAAVTQTGMHIQDQGQNTQASGINAGLLIDNQTPGANVYSIYTKKGPVWFGDWVYVVSDASASGYALDVAATSTTSLNGMNSYTTVTDSSAGSLQAVGLYSAGLLAGTVTNTDVAFGIIGSAGNTGTGAAAEVSAFLAYSVAPSSTPAETITGMHITDMNSSGTPGSTVNAGLLIDNQTAGANVYAIKTGLGKVSLGDETTINTTVPVGSGTGLFITANTPADLLGDTGFGMQISSLNNSMGGVQYGAEIGAFYERSDNATLIVGAEIYAAADDGGGTATNARSLLISSTSGGMTNEGIFVAAISDTHGTNYGMHVSDITGGPTANYAIKTGAGAVSLGDVLETAPVLFASLGTPTNGSIVYCSNCDTPLTPGAACASSGDMAGAAAIYARSGWECF